MRNAPFNGEALNPLRDHQERTLVPPPFKLPEALIEDVTRLARQEGLTPGQLVENILRPAVANRSAQIQAEERLKKAGQLETPEKPLPIDYA